MISPARREVSLRQGGHDQLVFPHRLDPASVRRKRGVAGSPGSRHQGRVYCLQCRVLRSIDNGEMNLVVELEIRLALTRRVVARHAFVDALKFVEVWSADALCRQFAGVAFDASDCLEQVKNVLDRQFAHARPTARQEVDKPFSRQQLGCLANRRARDLQDYREVSVVETLPRCKLPFDDHIPQPFSDCFMEWFWPNDSPDGPLFQLSSQRITSFIVIGPVSVALRLPRPRP